MISSAGITDLQHDTGFAALKRYIIEATGLAYYNDKDDDLHRRVGQRLSQCTARNYAEYLSLLHQPKIGDVELDKLVEHLTVGETSFFRHAELFEGLRHEVLPNVLKRNASVRRLRIWSAGCSNGAEPYSLAIMLTREFSEIIGDWEVSILGTDINRQSLARANEGVFKDWDFRGSVWSNVKDCFTRKGNDWLIRPEHRKWVSFQYHNLVRHPYPSLINNLVAFDIILCRNVLIYFSPDIMEHVIGQFHGCLVDGGWLLVGHAEPNTRVFRAYETVNYPGAVFYRRNDDAAPIASVPAPSPSRPAAFVELNDARVTQPPIALSKPREKRRAPQTSNVTPAAEPRHQDLIEPIRRMADNGRLDAALEACQKLIFSSEMNPALYLHLALLSEQLGDHRQAEIALRRAIYLNPTDALAHYFSGLLQQKLGRRAEAIRAFRTVLDMLRSRPDDAWIPDVERLTVGGLRELARMQQEVLGET